MKITLNELKGMQIGLEEAMALKIPPKTAYWFKRFMVRVVSEFKAIEKVRLQLALKYAKKGKDGKPLFKKDKDGKTLNEYDLTKDNLIKFAKEFDELCQKEIDFPFEPRKLEDFGDTKLSGDLLYKLGKLVQE
jgi:hypothetical protein